MGGFVLPPALKPGDRIRLVAPSSPFDRALFFRGAGFLAERYRVELSRSVLKRHGLFAGSDAERRADLAEAFADPEVRAVVAARGGYGAGRIAHLLDWSAMRRAPKWLVGFSDVTALHIEAQTAGLCSLHAHNAAGLGRGDARGREQWLSALEAPNSAPPISARESLLPGRARGPLAGGNLSVLFASLAAGRLRLPQGCVLAIEDVSEASYRIDRMLSAMIVGGLFRPVSAVLVGDFTDCPPGATNVPVEAVLRERLSALGVPVLLGLPFGHGRHNVPLLLGGTYDVDATALAVRQV